ncbi:MAG: hypothetical protein LBL08_00430 [Candidatus Nomurabacteria bacterium]|nr:hypothetical protein [Candidatus Nomurabacteria bacterium]
MTKTTLAAVMAVVMTLSSGAVALAESPYFVVNEPADQTVDEGDDATFLYDIDTSRARELWNNNSHVPGVQDGYYTWLQVKTSKIANFNTSIPTNCLPFAEFVNTPNWIKNGDTYTVTNPNCSGGNSSNNRAISVMISDPFTVDGETFVADQWYMGMAVSGRAVVSFDYDISGDNYGPVQIFAVPYADIAANYANFLSSGMASDLANNSVAGSDSESPALTCADDGLYQLTCYEIKSGSNWIVMPDQGEYVLVVINDVHYDLGLDSRAQISNITVNNVVREVGKTASLTLSSGDASYFNGARFMAFVTVYPGADYPLDWASRVATLRFKSNEEGGGGGSKTNVPKNTTSTKQSLKNIGVPNAGQPLNNLIQMLISLVVASSSSLLIILTRRGFKTY